MNKGLELYLAEVESHKAKYLKELNELRFDLNQSSLKSRDYLAAERLLQVFTEMCIGLSKHMVKKIQNKSPTEAYQSFSLLKENGLISSNELRTWKQIIGMRNGLVHDYLNIDLLIVEDILREGHYQALADFTEKAITFLLSE